MTPEIKVPNKAAWCWAMIAIALGAAAVFNHLRAEDLATKLAATQEAKPPRFVEAKFSQRGVHNIYESAESEEVEPYEIVARVYFETTPMRAIVGESDKLNDGHFKAEDASVDSFNWSGVRNGLTNLLIADLAEMVQGTCGEALEARVSSLVTEAVQRRMDTFNPQQRPGAVQVRDEDPPVN